MLHSENNNFLRAQLRGITISMIVFILTPFVVNEPINLWVDEVAAERNASVDLYLLCPVPSLEPPSELWPWQKNIHLYHYRYSLLAHSVQCLLSLSFSNICPLHPQFSPVVSSWHFLSIQPLYIFHEIVIHYHHVQTIADLHISLIHFHYTPLPLLLHPYENLHTYFQNFFIPMATPWCGG